MKKQRDLVIFHYHLLPGGVTDVIRLSLQAFSGDPQFGRISVVCGRNANIPAMEEELKRIKQSATGPHPALAIRILPALDYLEENREPTLSMESLQDLLLNHFGGIQTIWLIHNYHLGKNWLFTKALLDLAEKGDQKMIFQIHDFPECGRFGNLQRLKEKIPGSLYTNSPSVRYCVINKRDYDLLRQAGISESRLFLLENALPEERKQDRIEKSDKKELIEKLSSYAPPNGELYENGEIWLYPVRSIRRKNILEGGIIARLSEKPVNLIVTLPGISPQEKAYSNMVEQAYKEGWIPGFWGTGNLPEESGIGYRDMIASADRIFSSSIQEGFGFMYLNAILWNKPLVARFLDIMGGFLPLFASYPSHFYSSLLVPCTKPQKAALRQEYLSRFDAIRPKLDKGIRAALITQLDALLEQEGIDYSYLSPRNQYAILKTLKEEKGYARECRDLNRELLSRVNDMNQPETPSHKDKLYAHYGLASYREAFRRITASFDGERSTGTESPRELPDNFLLRGFGKLEYMRLLYS